jgi:hypothetical protein
VSELTLEAPELLETESADRVGDGSSKRFALAAGIGVLVASVPFLWVLMDEWSGSYQPLRSIPFFSDFFDLQAESILHGRLSVAPGSLGIEGYIHDGRTYTYFGLLPSLLRIPIILIAPSLKGHLTVLSMLLAWMLIGFFSSLLIWRVRVLLRGGDKLTLAEAGSFGLLVATIMGGSVLLWLGSQPWVYNEDIMWSIAITVATLFLFLGVLERPSPGRIVAAGALILAGVLSRSTPALSCIVGALLIACWFAVGRSQVAHRRWAWPMAVAAFVPLLVYFAVNLQKFGTLLSDPLTEQVWTQLNAHRKAFLASTSNRGFALHLLPTGLQTYLQPFGLRVEPTFPFLMLPIGAPIGVGGVIVDLTYPTASVPATMPLLFLLTCGAVLVSFLRRTSDALMLMRIPLLVGGGACLIDFFLGYYAPRFLGDFMPLLVLGGAIGTAELWRGRHSGVLIRRIVVSAFVVLGLFSMWANIGLAASPTTEWTTTQTSNFIRTVKSFSDVMGHPINQQVKQGFPLPNWAPAGEIFVVGQCAGLYISSGDRFDTVPLLQDEHKTWLGVYLGVSTFYLGKGVPILRVGTDTILLRSAGKDRAQFVLKDSKRMKAGPVFKPQLRHANLYVLETNPTTREVIIDNGVGLVAYLSAMLSGGAPDTLIRVRTLQPNPVVAAAVFGKVNPKAKPTDTSLCRSLMSNH